MDYKKDNRWSPGGSGAIVAHGAPAAYAARWIDQGDEIPADVVPDRQGFAYNELADRERLVAFMEGDRMIRTPGYTCLGYDRTTVIVNHPDWHMYQRRAGGYIYVDAWLTPSPQIA